MQPETDSPRVRYADDTLLVVDKPAGLLAVPGRGESKQDCLSARVQTIYPDALVVHRLDMATSGLMLMARGKEAQRALSRAFAERRINKKYVALVHGHLPAALDGWGVIDLPLAADWPNRPRRVVRVEGGKPSVTRWRVMAQSEAHTTRVELEPETGRSHQLRVHMLAIGHPIIGDRLYGGERDGAGAGRLMLHATQIAFVHPVTSVPMHFSSLPEF